MGWVTAKRSTEDNRFSNLKWAHHGAWSFDLWLKTFRVSRFQSYGRRERTQA